MLFLLDGFDEIGIQSWSSDADKLREVRAQALSGVQDAVKNSGTGILITGREHYFSTDQEMFASLGLKKSDTLLLHVRDEFSTTELLEYFRATNIDVTLPEWLPRRPLICQTIAALPEADRNGMFRSDSNAVDFWHHFMRVICERDARINKSFNSDTIYDVFVALANLTRTKSANTGPINQRELQESFEGVVGALPVENASVMLQRLPSLGRVGPESSDRQFIGTYILDGLRAIGIKRYAESDEDSKKKAVAARWTNSLGDLGQSIVAREAESKPRGFISLAERAAAAYNHVLASDIAASMTRTSGEVIRFNNLVVADSAITELDLSECNAAGLTFLACTMEELVLPTLPPTAIKIDGCLISRVSGASSESGLPAWITNVSVEEYDSVRTMRRIRDAGLEAASEVLVVIVKKTFFQPGTGRKEEALTRGFEAGRHGKVFKKVLSILTNSGILETFKGKEGTVYTPNRSETSRMQAMLDELKSSQDPVWVAVSAL